MDPSLMLNYTSDIFNDSYTMADIFDVIQSEITINSLGTIMHMCIYIFSNETVLKSLEADDNFVSADGIFQTYNLSDVIVDWFKNKNQTVIAFCDGLKAAAEETAHVEEDTGMIFVTCSSYRPIVNMELIFFLFVCLLACLMD